MIEALLIWLGAIIATEAVVELIVASEILFNIRDRVAQHSVFFGKLVNCGYCVSVWVAALMFSYHLPIGNYLGSLCLNSLYAHIMIVIGKAAIIHRMSTVLHESFSRRFHKHRFGIELVHTVNEDKR